MTARKTAELARIAAVADHTINLNSDLKPAAIDDALRDLSILVKAMLRKKRSAIGIVLVSNSMK